LPPFFDPGGQRVQKQDALAIEKKEHIIEGFTRLTSDCEPYPVRRDTGRPLRPTGWTVTEIAQGIKI
jgi:hypothetical protein